MRYEGRGSLLACPVVDVPGRRFRVLVGARLRWNGVVDAMSFLARGSDTLLWHDGRSLWYLPEGQGIAVRLEFP